MPHVVLYQPTIPPNTGNIARQCVGMQMPLHLIGPITMDLSSKAVRRAGLDYWPHLDLTVHDNPETFLTWLANRRFWLITKHGQRFYPQADFAPDDVLIFGSEISGLPPEWLTRWADRTLSIPMPGPVRSYNLANAVAIVMAAAFTARTP